MKKTSKILVLGASGMVGGAIVAELYKRKYTCVLLPSHEELDLANQLEVIKYFLHVRPEYVFLCAARVGGILDNIKHPASYLSENLMIQQNVMSAAHACKVKKLMFFASSCMYPAGHSKPMKESLLLCGKPEKTNEAYAMAKLCGTKMAQYFNEQYGCNFVTVVPCNVYGPGDKFSPTVGHVVGSLFYKFIRAVDHVVVLGDGAARREFIYEKDLARISVSLMNKKTEPVINIGPGEDVSIKKLVSIFVKEFNFKGSIIWDRAAPSGVHRKLLDVSLMRSYGLKPEYSLTEGIHETRYSSYLGAL